MYTEKSVNCKINNSRGFTYTVHILTLTERHTAFCQTSPSQCELYPCGSHTETIFRNAYLTQHHENSPAYQPQIHVLNNLQQGHENA